MEDYFKELNSLHSKSYEINQHIARIMSLDYIGKNNQRQFIGISKDDNQRFSFDTIIEIIGEEKMNAHLNSLRSLIKSDLIEAKELNSKEINSFEIIKK